MAQNITFFDTANNIVDVFTGIIQNSQAFPLMILGLVFILLFVALQKYPVKHILVYNGLVTSILAALFIIIEWIDFSFLMLPVLILFGAIILNAVDRG